MVGTDQSVRCIVIDPARDVDQYVQISANHGTRIVYVFETHVHNDFVSGARELAEQTGCQVGASASGGLLFPSIRLQEDDEFDLGEFKIRIIHTPGHTPESASFMIEEQGQPRAIFTGGALMLGGAVRVDLLGSKIAPFLARWLHNTIHEKLLKLPDDVLVYPTQGGGSFCSVATAGVGEIPTTIARERRTNLFAAEAEESSFVKFALTGLGSYHSYYKYMADIDRRGPDILGGVPRLSSLTALSVRSYLDDEATDRLPQKRISTPDTCPAPTQSPTAIPWPPGLVGSSPGGSR